jgi:hypothetical protein
VNTWDRLVLLIAGKDVGVVGMRAAGKSRLHSFLRSGELPDPGVYLPTYNAQSVPAARPRLVRANASGQGRRVNIRKGIDVPGKISDSVSYWKSEVCESDIVLYLFDAFKVWSGDTSYGEEMIEQCYAVDALLANRPIRGRRNAKVFLVGTHVDQGPCGTLPSHTAQAMEFYAGVITAGSVVEAKSVLGRSVTNPAYMILGSLLTVETASDVCWRLFSQP